MKKILGFLCAASVLGLAGCSSGPQWPASLRERLSPTYRTHVVSVAQKPAYEAAREVLKEMHFRFVSGGPAQGRLEALGALQPGDGPRAARQISVNVKFAPALNTPSGTEVMVLFSEILEDTFSKREGMGTTTPLQDTPLYEVFFPPARRRLDGRCEIVPPDWIWRFAPRREWRAIVVVSHRVAF